MSNIDNPFAGGPFQFPIHLIGLKDGSRHFASGGWRDGFSASVVTGIDVWYSSSCLRAIQITYPGNQRSSIYGTSGDSHSSIVFAPGELVTSMTLWGNGVGTRTGRIRLTTDKGQTLDAGKDTSGQDAFDIDVGSGILVGFMGGATDEVEQLGAVFLRSAVAHVSITNVTYDPDLAGTDKGIQPVSLDQAHYSNPADSGKPMPWTFGGSTTRTQSTTFTEASGNIYGANVSVEVSGEVFGIGAKATAGFQWQHQSSTTTAATTSSTATLTWGLSGTLEPGESCMCNALVQRGEGRTNYSADVTIKLEDGTTNTFREDGVFHTIAYTQVDVSKQETKAGHVVEFSRYEDLPPKV